MTDVQTAPVQLPVPRSPAVQHLIRLKGEVEHRYPNLLILEGDSSDGACCFTVQRPGLSLSPMPSHSPVLNPRMIVSAPYTIDTPETAVTYSFEAHFTPLLTRFMRTEEDRSCFFNQLDTLLPDSGYHLCPGVPTVLASQLSGTSKNARKWGMPFNRVDHAECPLWYRTDRHVAGQTSLPTCQFCMGLGHYLKWQIKQKEAVSPSRRAKRSLPSSKCPLKYLTPTSMRKRLALTRQEKQGTERIEHLDVNLNEATNEELLGLVSRIEKHSRHDLEQILQEADKAGKGDILKAMWRQDVQEQLCYEKDQKLNGEAKKY